MITQICDACGRVIRLDDMITCSKCASQDDQLIRDLENQINALLKEIVGLENQIMLVTDHLAGLKNG